VAKTNFYNIDDIEKESIFKDISTQTGMPAFAVEKDWWVVQTLSIIFELEVAKHLVFKGGTSLSKAWKLIERFSEDVDLVIDREFFGFDGNLSKKQITDLRKAAGVYTSGLFFEALQQRFTAKGITGVEFKLVAAASSDQDPRIIEIYYPNIIPSPGYLQPKVQIEIGCRSLREPFTRQSFNALVDETYANQDFALPPIIVPTVNPERTFLEKIFLLHEEFQRPQDKTRIERLSRHLYDVVKLSKTHFAQKALTDQVLYATIVEHRFKFTKVGGVNYNLHQPQTINPVPKEDVLAAWKADYNTMIEQMIYENNPPSFNQIIADLKVLKNKINELPWQVKTMFPIGK
jgi:Nucleotidyl transferase AbiEii toxin, Type IV TA system